MARNFWNYSIRETTIGLENKVALNLNKSDGGITIVILDRGDL